MKTNLGKKALLVIAVLLVSLYGIFGLPTSLRSLRENMQKRIALGLDLRGGTHLVLQVMVNDSVNAEADQTIERLKNTLNQRQISFSQITRIDARELLDEGGIKIEGVPVEQTSAFRQAVEETEPSWTLNPQGDFYEMK